VYILASRHDFTVTMNGWYEPACHWFSHAAPSAKPTEIGILFFAERTVLLAPGQLTGAPHLRRTRHGGG
jgi:hypothetical protein